MRHLFLFAIAAGLAAGPAFAQDSTQHFDKAVTGFSDAAGNLGASGLQVVGGALAIPVSVVGTVSMVGAASDCASERWEGGPPRLRSRSSGCASSRQQRTRDFGRGRAAVGSPECVCVAQVVSVRCCSPARRCCQGAGSVAGEVGLDSVKTAQDSVDQTWGAPLAVDKRVVVAPDPAPKKALAR